MQARLSPNHRDSPQLLAAQSLLRACVHCGFCNATCPTYQLLGDELDGPRGRIYLIKQLLEGHPPTATTQIHLDRCLGCRSCETTCPSGVRYAQLLESGRGLIEAQVPRPLPERLLRRLILHLLPDPVRFQRLLAAARILRPLLPPHLRRQIPPAFPLQQPLHSDHGRRVLLLAGCVQPALAPQINAAAARVLDRLGTAATVADGCCGALAHHLPAREAGLAAMRRNIDAWVPYLDRGHEAIVSTASGCGLMIKEYHLYLQHDREYAAKAARVSAATLDLAEVIAASDLSGLRPAPRQRLACHTPCTLQHGQRLAGKVEQILTELGFILLAPVDSPACCGSAGSYSLLQPELSAELLRVKLEALEIGQPDCIVTANIGCLAHMRSGTRRPVRHWIEVVDDALRSSGECASADARDRSAQTDP